MKRFFKSSDIGKMVKSTSLDTELIESLDPTPVDKNKGEYGIPRSNSVPFPRVKNSRGVKVTDFSDINIQLNPMQEKVAEFCRSRKVSDLSSNSKQSSHKPEIPHEHKWTKLRTVMTMTSALKPKKPVGRQDSFIKKFTTQRCGNDDEFPQEKSENPEIDSVKIERTKLLHKLIIDPQSGTMCSWLGVVTLAVLYNLWTCIVRQAFTDTLIGFEMIWIFLDLFADVIYVLDIVVQLRTTYLERGLCVFNSRKLAQRYVHSKYFKIDLLSLFPLDIIQFFVGFQPLLRFPRFLKMYRAWKWKVIVENRTIFPNLWRVVNLTHILFLGCHWFAAFYFMISQVGGFQSNWGYPKPIGDFSSVTRKYLKSFYWSTLTLTTIGDLPPPERNWEYIFTIVSYLIGVFVFATIVGQVGNVITNRNANRLEFEKILDNAKNYMRVHNVPNDLQRRVMRWYDYAWSRGRASGCSDISSLALLPDKLKTEMALHVNLETLKKVTIFQECRPEFLHDLVLKMRPFIFTPGDLICRKGEVARELFIISDGVLEVISDSGDVLKKMGSGDFFGEIGILNLDCGVNRRSADVKSVGYSELFVLSKEDVLNALKDHPDAKELITRYGTNRLNEMKDRRCQKIIDRKAMQSSNNTSNVSLSKSLNSCEDILKVDDDEKRLDAPSMTLLKTILSRMKTSKQSPSKYILCSPDMALVQQPETGALENIGDSITYKTVPSTKHDVDCALPFFKNPKNAQLKKSLIVPHIFNLKKRYFLNNSIGTTNEMAKECQSDGENQESLVELWNRNHADGINTSNSAILNELGYDRRSVGQSQSDLINEFIDDPDLPQPTNQNFQSTNQSGALTNSELKLLSSAVESILISQTNREIEHLKEELNHMTVICSSQQNEIDRLKNEIKVLTSS